MCLQLRQYGEGFFIVLQVGLAAAQQYGSRTPVRPHFTVPLENIRMIKSKFFGTDKLAGSMVALTNVHNFL